MPYVAKLNPTGTALVYSTFLSNSLTSGALLGGFGNSIALDPARNAYVFGGASRGAISVLDPPSPPDGGDTATSNNRDAFLATVSADGSRLLFASYLGGSAGSSAPIPAGSGFTSGGGIALDKNLNVYVSSITNASNFPITAGAAQPKCGASACAPGPANVYITKISPVGGGVPQDGGSDGAVGASDASGDSAPIADTGTSDASTPQDGSGSTLADGAATQGDGSAGIGDGGSAAPATSSVSCHCNFASAKTPTAGIGLIPLALLAFLRRRRASPERLQRRVP